MNRQVVEDTWEDDSAEDELKGSASASSSQNTQVSTPNQYANNNNTFCKYTTALRRYRLIVGVISTDGYDLDHNIM